jgi:hypothetical protein
LNLGGFPTAASFAFLLARNTPILVIEAMWLQTVPAGDRGFSTTAAF